MIVPPARLILKGEERCTPRQKAIVLSFLRDVKMLDRDLTQRLAFSHRHRREFQPNAELVSNLRVGLLLVTWKFQHNSLLSRWRWPISVGTCNHVTKFPHKST
ncbi:hypothetical protein IscW_ISCW005113 [Ixodes scapularis]|uniref:Uncharacterized protein n=1 Tax=Ixodes scapularis TaxID=6945 RepID=B7PFK2_IXOSC|nr:hypothetical protein IscW_ISCW005113 [Ixodes scapularis]|eukprot:XP_002433974.1 hypothetical protein IscW_ISCW005113 [Ixodes scapularis]